MNENAAKIARGGVFPEGSKSKEGFAISDDAMSNLEDIHFKYERLDSLVECLWMLISEGAIEIKGAPENTIDHSLYEIKAELYKNNQELKSIIENAYSLRRAAS